MNMDAIYNRPFLSIGKLPVAVGGYVEADYTYIGTDGVTDGHSFRIPRLDDVYCIIHSSPDQIPL